MIRDSPEASSSPVSPAAAAALIPLVTDSDNTEEDDTFISVDKVKRSSPIMLVESDFAEECEEPVSNTPISPVSLTPSPSPSPALLPEVSVTQTEDVFEFSEIDPNR